VSGWLEELNLYNKDTLLQLYSQLPPDAIDFSNPCPGGPELISIPHESSNHQGDKVRPAENLQTRSRIRPSPSASPWGVRWSRPWKGTTAPLGELRQS
jgi:hypothetical protein